MAEVSFVSSCGYGTPTAGQGPRSWPVCHCCRRRVRLPPDGRQARHLLVLLSLCWAVRVLTTADRPSASGVHGADRL